MCLSRYILKPFMGILQRSTGLGMLPPAPELAFLFEGQSPPDQGSGSAKYLRLILSAVEFLQAEKSSLCWSELLHQVLSVGSGHLSQSIKGESCPWSFALPPLGVSLHAHLEFAVLTSLLGSASTSFMPVTQHNCRGMLCEPQGIPLHREEGDEVLGPDSKWLALPAVTQKLAKGAQKECVCVCVYSELWHLKWCHVAKCGTAKFF